MPELEETAACLRFFGDDLDPDYVSQRLGKKGHREERRGDVRQFRSGRTRVAKMGGWTLRAERRAPGDLNGQLRELFEGLSDDLSVWADLLAYSDRADVFCGLFLEEQTGGVHLEPDVLKLVVDRGLMIDFDIYACMEGYGRQFRWFSDVETDRLILRLPRESDFEAYTAIWADPEVVRFIGGVPRSRERCREAWEKNLESWKSNGFGNWVIEERGGGAVVGQVGFFYGEHGLGSDFDASPECGWVITPAFAGKGYGSEAVLAAHRRMDDCSGGTLRTVCMIEVGHEASLHLARKAGYREMRRAEYQGAQLILMERKPDKAGPAP